MRITQPGDHVQVHYVKRFQDGSVASSRGRPPLEMIVGTDHPRLPGLGMGLVGLAAGESTKLRVAPEDAYGLRDPNKVRRVSRTRFQPDQLFKVGKMLRVTDRKGKPHLVRVLETRTKVVVVDTNHPWAGQVLEMEVQLVTIHDPATGFQAK